MCKDEFNLKHWNIRPSMAEKIKAAIADGTANLEDMSTIVLQKLKEQGPITSAADLDDVYCQSIAMANCFGQNEAALATFRDYFQAQASQPKSYATQVYVGGLEGMSFDQAMENVPYPG